jgi:hypothetical protein
MTLYYTITTVTTVGYGDISATSNLEMILACFTMITGVLIFSLTTSTVVSIVESFDDSNEEVTKKLDILHHMKIDYHISETLYHECYASLS